MPADIETLQQHLSDALDRENAAREVLAVISRSTTELQPALDTIVRTAARLCQASWALIFKLAEDGVYRLAAASDVQPDALRFFEENPATPTRSSVTGRAILEGRTVHVPDIHDDAEHTWFAAQDVAQQRTVMAVPLIRDGVALGVITLARDVVRPFTDKQIELVTAFADQAVIAIENVRLFNAEKTRTLELSEALERQTATSEVLGVISKSLTDAQPVFDAIVQSGARLFPNAAISIALPEGDKVKAVSIAESDPARAEAWRQRFPFPLTREYMHSVAILERRIVDVPDAESALDEFAAGARNFLETGYRAVTIMPMMRGDEAIGALSIVRLATGPLSDKQLALLRTFAAQAVIAIENVRLFEAEQARTQELMEALERQTATGEVLNVISRSMTQLQPVLDSIADTAARLCKADWAVIRKVESDGKFHPAASCGASADLIDFITRHPIVPGRGSVASRALLERKTLHVPDVKDDPDYSDLQRDVQRIGKFRTVLCVPLMRGGEPIGVISLVREEPQAFSESQVSLVSTFADQAVIAIENVRLFEEVQARTRALAEALEQQKATTEILQVISHSPTDLQPVFATIAKHAVLVCGAEVSTVTRFDGELAHLGAAYGSDEAGREALRKIFPMPIGVAGGAARAILERKAIQISDVVADQEYQIQDAALAAGFRSLLAVPMIRGERAIGAITVGRAEPGTFSDAEVKLLGTFADQAVIAIENARLFDEVQARTDDLAESLRQQTATADVLKVISRSAFDLQTVLDTLLESAARLCDADIATIRQRAGDGYRLAATYGCTPEWREHFARYSTSADRGSVFGRTIVDGRTVNIPDVLADAEFNRPEAQKLMGFRAALGVPMLREGNVVGVLNMFRFKASSFNDKQIELVETFADQAAIAIENVRLFDEVQARTEDLAESLKQQTATADVLKVISRSALDLSSVLNTLVEAAARLCEADQGTIARKQNGEFRRVVSYGFSEAFDAAVTKLPVELERGSATGRSLVEGHVVHIPDVQEDPEYTFDEAKQLGGFRTILAVPMLREGAAIGVIALTRIEARPFTDKQIELVSTFADQAAIAIENVRLFESSEARSRELAASLEELRTAQDRLIQTEKLASLGQLTAGIAHEIKNPLNFINNFASVSSELAGELRELVEDLDGADTTRSEVDELTQTIRENLDKIVQHGQRADSIVKNMLLHARQGSSEHRLVDVNSLVEESLNLAYHGARAEGRGFNVTLERSLDPSAGDVELYPQEITRVLLNLITNGFYAMRKRKDAAADADYEPIMRTATRDLGDRVEITIRDNGTGIPPDVRARLFTPFFTTKPAGEGTGLGLSISHDIVVKQHHGSIEVDSEPNKFTEFRIVLPRRHEGGTGAARS